MADIYSLETHDFMNDKGFQAFFKEKLGNKWLKPDTFMRRLNNAKKEWIRLLTTPNPLIHRYLSSDD